MTGRRGPGGPPSDIPNGHSLESLGRQIEAGGARPSNEDSLLNLGRAIDTKGGRGTRRRRRKRRTTRIVLFSAVGLVVLIAAIVGGAYIYGYYQYKKLQDPTSCDVHHVKVCVAELSGKPFNVLAIGSDSRVGLPPAIARVTGGGTITGSRSDVVKVFHVDPAAGTISVVSFPRDTMTTLLANQNLYSNFNRLNVNYENGPGLLVQTMRANFGIQINHVVQVGFGGLAGAVNALGGINMSFPYPSLDQYSSLNIHHPGCQRLMGFMGLAVARSRHFEYYTNGAWQYDLSSDYSRIDRQNQFLRAMIIKAKSVVNPATINAFIGSLPQGVKIDDTFGYNELIGLAEKFHTFNPAALNAYTLPTTQGTVAGIGDVLFVEQPLAQQMLVKVFGQVGPASAGGLVRPTNPPPNSLLQTPQPPPVIVAVVHKPKPPVTSGTTKPTVPTTTTTTLQPIHSEPWFTFNPVACTPK